MADTLKMVSPPATKPAATTKLVTSGRLAESIQVRPSAPPSSLKLATSKPGYIKVRLSFLTPKANHLRSLQLAYAYNIKPPYNEDVCVLLPRMKVVSLLENFIPAFEYLQGNGVVPKSAKLRDFHILDEDNLTISYIF